MYLCRQDAIAEASAKGFDLGDQAVFVVRQAGRFYAYRNRCPHLGVRLEWLPDRFLDSGNELIMCATHGALFVIETGACVAGPCRGQSLEPVTVSLADGNLYLQPAAGGG
ncbi:Rieske (2Fe-2S) protein [Exilibacterium tricleocarpae]|uniref:Rieske (2Fe-2S) protein n=1 Tax=Exilibacterium tricleocarpae TaxID=2591008 RepID=A0A545STN9_9GAMM|nr:Rieske (2Fe-2S) protein [Exilibacterium tricleocarpae]